MEVTEFDGASVAQPPEPRETAPRPAASHPRRRPRRWLPLFLFLVTIVSTFLAGTVPGAGMAMLPIPTEEWWPRLPEWFARLPDGFVAQLLSNGAVYCLAVMGTLLCHEMGHYLQARRHGVPASLPYFIPFPISPFGTMGAVIVQGAHPPNRRVLFDIAISGPLAGLVLALPIAWYGVQHSEISQFPPDAENVIQYGDPLILQWMVEAKHGPLGENQDVSLENNPLLFAGWVGIFITALNLIPIGQLDGGHVLYTLIGKWAHAVAFLLIAGAFAFMIYVKYPAYILMLLLLMLTGPRHPPTGDDTVPLGTMRIVLGWLTLAFIVVGFTPIPIRP